MLVADMRNAKCGVATSFTTCLFTRFEPKRRLFRPESIPSLRLVMELDPAIRTELLASAPMLRKFALCLCGTIDGAEELVQETFVQAIANIDTFQPDTKLSAWLATILRNRFLSQCRKRRREVEDVEGQYAETLKSEPEQSAQVDFADFRTALSKLPSEQRQALLLVGASGLSYDEAAAQCGGCPAGTIKSRTHRARARLADLLAIDALSGFGPDRVSAVVGQRFHAGMGLNPRP
jgi:RNA polymerase sigma-70 factor, ECF subfamily